MLTTTRARTASPESLSTCGEGSRAFSCSQVPRWMSASSRPSSSSRRGRREVSRPWFKIGSESRGGVLFFFDVEKEKTKSRGMRRNTTLFLELFAPQLPQLLLFFPGRLFLSDQQEWQPCSAAPCAPPPPSAAELASGPFLLPPCAGSRAAAASPRALRR